MQLVDKLALLFSNYTQTISADLSVSRLGTLIRQSSTTRRQRKIVLPYHGLYRSYDSACNKEIYNVPRSGLIKVAYGNHGVIWKNDEVATTPQ